MYCLMMTLYYIFTTIYLVKNLNIYFPSKVSSVASFYLNSYPKMWFSNPNSYLSNHLGADLSFNMVSATTCIEDLTYIYIHLPQIFTPTAGKYLHTSSLRRGRKNKRCTVVFSGMTGRTHVWEERKFQLQNMCSLHFSIFFGCIQGHHRDMNFSQPPPMGFQDHIIFCSTWWDARGVTSPWLVKHPLSQTLWNICMTILGVRIKYLPSRKLTWLAGNHRF